MKMNLQMLMLARGIHDSILYGICYSTVSFHPQIRHNRPRAHCENSSAQLSTVMFLSAFFSLGLCLTYTIESLFSSTSSAERKYWDSEWPSFQRIGVSLRQRRLVQRNRHHIRWPALGIQNACTIRQGHQACYTPLCLLMRRVRHHWKRQKNSQRTWPICPPSEKIRRGVSNLYFRLQSCGEEGSVENFEVRSLDAASIVDS